MRSTDQVNTYYKIRADNIHESYGSLFTHSKALFKLPCKEVRRPKAFWFLIIGDKEAKVPCNPYVMM